MGRVINSIGLLGRRFKNYCIVGLISIPIIITLTFTLTGCGDSVLEVGVKDTNPLKVIFTNPSNGQLGVPTSMDIEVCFNKLLEASTVTAETVKLHDGENYVQIEIELAGNIITIRPDMYVYGTYELRAECTYTLTVTIGLKDTYGYQLETDYVLSFNTVIPTVLSTTGDRVEGDITSYYGEQWYSVNATKGMAYALYLYNSYNTTKYTGEVRIYAYDENLKRLDFSWYQGGESFIAPYSGKIYFKAYAYDVLGTYAIELYEITPMYIFQFDQEISSTIEKDEFQWMYFNAQGRMGYMVTKYDTSPYTADVSAYAYREDMSYIYSVRLVSDETAWPVVPTQPEKIYIKIKGTTQGSYAVKAVESNDVVTIDNPIEAGPDAIANINASGVSSDGVASISVYIDSIYDGEADIGYGTWSYLIDVSALSAGAHDLTIEPYDDTNTAFQTSSRTFGISDYLYTLSIGAGYGAGDGQFKWPYGFAVDNDYVYVADIGNDRIQKFDKNGIFISSWGGSGSGNGQFDYPYAIAVEQDALGYVYVADNGNGRVQKFLKDGTYITQWSVSGNLYSIAIDSSNVYIGGYDSIRVYTKTGSSVTSWTGSASGHGFKSIYDIEVDSTTLYVADYENNHIQRWTTGGTYIDEWGTSGTGDGQFNYPFGIDVDSNYVFVADSQNYRIQMFNKSPSPPSFFSKWGTEGWDEGYFYNPYDIELDSDGKVFVLDNSKCLVQVYE